MRRPFKDLGEVDKNLVKKEEKSSFQPTPSYRRVPAPCEEGSSCAITHPQTKSILSSDESNSCGTLPTPEEVRNALVAHVATAINTPNIMAYFFCVQGIKYTINYRYANGNISFAIFDAYREGKKITSVTLG